MKRISIFFFIISILSTPLRSQDDQLPEDIYRYYQDKNFVNTICLRGEKPAVIFKASRGGEFSYIKDDRLRKATKIMRRVVQRILQVNDDMPNNMYFSKPRLPSYLELSELDYITAFEKSKDKIILNIDTYSFDEEINAKYVAAYTPNQTPENYQSIDFSELKFKCKEVHEWIFQYGHWYKPAVHIILVDQ